MGRSRNIKPGFFKNEELAKADPLARITFAGLWTIADRRGVLEYRPERIKIEVLPYDSCNFAKLLDTLATLGFIRYFEDSGTKYIFIPTFTAHQNPHKNEAESGFPAPPKSLLGKVLCKTPEISGNAAELPAKIGSTRADSLFSDSLLSIAGSGETGNTPKPKPEPKTKPRTVYPPEFDELWFSYPAKDGRREGKEKTLKLWRLIPKDERPLVKIAVANYAQSRKVLEGFIKDPERFLKDGVWRDYLDDKAAPAPSVYGELQPLRRAE